MALLFDTIRIDETLKQAHRRFFEIQDFIVDRLTRLEYARKQMWVFFRDVMGVKNIVIGNMHSSGMGINEGYTDDQYLVANVIIKGLSKQKISKMYASRMQSKFNQEFKHLGMSAQSFNYDATTRSLTFQMFLK